ncbi:MAG: hypothetical protein IJM79_00435 [Erysipelotrichaceae bacterium]|nr:hypothetical protein [Erysipelotrichaceae bacterium]
MFTTLYGKVLIGCLAALTVISFAAALSNRRTTDSYTSVIMTALAYGLIEIIWHACTNDLVTFSENVVKLVGSFRVVFVVLLSYMLVNYFMSRSGRKLDGKILIFVLVQIVILLDVNIFYLLMFGYTEETGLQKGSLYPLPYGVFAVFGLLLLILSLSNQKKDLMAIISALLMIGCGVGQIFTEQLPLIYLGFALIMTAVTLTLPSRSKKPAEAVEEEQSAEAAAEEEAVAEEETVIEEYPLPESEEIVEPQPEVIEEPAQEIESASVEQLPEYTFDFIDEALQEENVPEPAAEELSQGAESIITEENFIEDIPELKQIEELIESESATDLPVISEEQQASQDSELQSILDEISETIASDTYEELPPEEEPAVEEPPVIEELPPVIPEAESLQPAEELSDISEALPLEEEPEHQPGDAVTEDTLTSLNAIQQAYDTEIENDRQKEEQRRQKQQLHNQKIISKPVISPLGPMPRPVVQAAVAATAAAEVADQLFEGEIAEEEKKPTKLKPQKVREVGEQKISEGQPLSYEKPEAVARRPLDEVRPAEEETKPQPAKTPRQARTPVTLPSIDEIITASYIAHPQSEEQPAAETVEAVSQAQPPKAEKSYRPRRRKSYRIMIIGSSSSEVRMITEGLKKEKGYRIDVIDDGYLAMELLAGPFAKVFDGILAVDQPSYSDIYSTIRMIRDCEFREIATLPIVCVVNDDPRRNMMIQNSGVDAFVMRPLDVNALSAVLREQLERHGW